MKRQKIANTDDYLMSSNDCEDDCPICRLMKKVEKEVREPTMGEIEKAMTEAKE